MPRDTTSSLTPSSQPPPPLRRHKSDSSLGSDEGSLAVADVLEAGEPAHENVWALNCLWEFAEIHRPDALRRWLKVNELERKVYNAATRQPVGENGRTLEELFKLSQSKFSAAIQLSLLPSPTSKKQSLAEDVLRSIRDRLEIVAVQANDLRRLLEELWTEDDFAELIKRLLETERSRFKKISAHLERLKRKKRLPEPSGDIGFYVSHTSLLQADRDLERQNPDLVWSIVASERTHKQPSSLWRTICFWRRLRLEVAKQLPDAEEDWSYSLGDLPMRNQLYGRMRRIYRFA